MKKLFLLAMIGMITSCSNSNDEIPKKEDVTLSQKAIDIVKESRKSNLTSKVYIPCHTSYSSNYGHSCVYSSGHLFSVSWQPDGSGQFDPDTGNLFLQYTATAVSSCGCS